MRRLLFVLTFVLYLSTLVSPVLGQANLYKDKRDAIKEGGNQEGWLNESFASNAVVALQTITGEIPDSVLTGNVTGYIPSGMFGIANTMISALFMPPASGIQYIASLKDSFLGKPAYAQQGFGFSGLQPILPIWRGFRNIIYLLSALIFIIIGVMIMLRVKISPQAVITVQNAIPQIVTTLILVTFSYAIAGLLIDLMTFFQGVIIALLFQASGTGFGSSLLPGIKDYSFDTLTSPGIGTFANLTIRALPMSVFLVWGSILGTLLGSFWSVPGMATGAIVGPVIVLLVVTILVVFWMFKFYMGCLKAYVYIIFKIVVAPLELGMGAFPNSKMNFSSWIWDIIANLAIFPISLIVMVVGNMIIDFSKKGLWAPSVLSLPSLPGAVTAFFTLSSIDGPGLSNVITIGIGIALVGMISILPERVPEFIFAIKPSPWGKAIGESYAPYGKMATTAAWQGGNMGLNYVETGGGNTKVANLINRIPGVNVTGEDVSKATGTLKAGYQTAGAQSGQKFS